MKKLLSILVCALAICGCGKSKVKPFELEDKYYGEGKFIQVNEASELKTLEDDKESYIVYIYLGGCLICQAFKPRVQEVIEDKGLIVYEAPIEFLKEANSVIAKKVKYAPSLVLMHDGKVAAYLDTSKDKDSKYYESVEELASYIDKYIIQK